MSTAIQDGRFTEQSIQLSLWRWLMHRGSALVIPNFVVWAEADMFAITKAGFGVEYEVKTSVADFRNDRLKVEKHATYRGEIAEGKTPPYFPNFFYYVVPERMVSYSDIPPYAGLLWVQPTGFVTVNKRPVRMHTQKVPGDVLLRAAKSMMWRYWQVRHRLQLDGSKL